MADAMAQVALSPICNFYNFSKYNIFHKPDEAMLLFMVKACLWLEIFLFYRTFENSIYLISANTLNSACQKVAFNKKSAITKENLHTKYTPFTYNDITLNEKPPIMKQNLHIVFSL